MEDFSTLIGGIAGDGINEAGLTVAWLLAVWAIAFTCIMITLHSSEVDITSPW